MIAEIGEITSGIWLGIETSKGSVNFVQFTDSEEKNIEGLTTTFQDKTIFVNIPRSYDVNGKITANFNLTQTDGLPFLTTKTGTSGTEDGIILAEKTVTFYEGESVFNLLLRESRRNGIHMEYVSTPIYNSAYIEGIHNLYEFDCGELSGWMYSVNGWFPNYGCSRYALKEGDRVEWVYTCALGRDVK